MTFDKISFHSFRKWMLIHFQFFISIKSFSQFSISFFSNGQNLENLFHWWKTWTKTPKFIRMSPFCLFYDQAMNADTTNANTISWTRKETPSSASFYCLKWWRDSTCLRNAGFFMLSLWRGRPRRVWRLLDPGKRRFRAFRCFFAAINTILFFFLSLVLFFICWHRLDRGFFFCVARRVVWILIVCCHHIHHHCYDDFVNKNVVEFSLINYKIFQLNSFFYSQFSMNLQTICFFWFFL